MSARARPPAGPQRAKRARWCSAHRPSAKGILADQKVIAFGDRPMPQAAVALQPPRAFEPPGQAKLAKPA